MLMYTCNLSSWDVEARRTNVYCYLQPHSYFGDSMDIIKPYFSKKFSKHHLIYLVISCRVKNNFEMRQKNSNEQENGKFTCTENLNTNQSETDEINILSHKVCFNWFWGKKN